MNVGEGMRRLAILCGVVGGLLGCVGVSAEVSRVWHARNVQQPHAPQVLTDSDIAAYDAKNSGVQAAPTTPAAGQDWFSRNAPRRSTVPAGYTLDPVYQPPEASVAVPPKLSAYLPPLAVPVIGFLMPWIAIRAFGWVLIGFRRENSGG